MKKNKANLIFYFLSTIFLMMLFSNVVMADVPEDIAKGTTSFIEGVKSFGGPVFEAILGSSETGNQFVIQILAFILATLIVYGILDSVNIFGGRSGLNFAVGAIVALIGIRFLPSGLLEAIALPSSALVAAIVLLVPFVIAFYIIEVKMEKYSIAGKLIWIALGIIIIFLWFNNMYTSSNQGWLVIYPIMAFACFIVLWKHGTIQKWIGKAKTDTSLEKTGNIERDRIVAKIKDLQTALAGAESNEERIRLNREIVELRKNLESI
ncbi:hypothetical protein HYW75_04255 [Candidatus Pacearchaeota archaeon]|nr:hypothetical protein [Candidatus Pacearchaeota archaeon]